MSDENTQTPTRRMGNPNWLPGGSGAGRNTRGPKPRFTSFAEKVREAISEEELISFAVDAIRNPETPWRERIQLHNYLTLRSQGAIPTTIDLTVGKVDTWVAPANWSYLSQSERSDYLDGLRSRALLGVIDVDDVDDEGDHDGQEE